MLLLASFATSEIKTVDDFCIDIGSFMDESDARVKNIMAYGESMLSPDTIADLQKVLAISKIAVKDACTGTNLAEAKRKVVADMEQGQFYLARARARVNRDLADAYRKKAQ